VTVPPIPLEELRRRLEAAEPVVVVDALSPISYAHSHLPGAINLPPERVDASVARRIPERDAEIVVYCANPDCESSLETARALLALGYTNVRHYAGGKDEWRRHGLPLERAGETLTPRAGGANDG
jgi:rhodanese-related sulfurtransferase